jgi:hypothetical protein
MTDPEQTEKKSVTIKLPNGAEFSATGSEEHVQELFKQFMALMSATAATTPATPERARGHIDERHDRTSDQPTVSGVSADLMSRLFAQDRLGTISLTALPPGDERQTDIMIAILYGYAKLRNETTVTADRLMKSARQSGVSGDVRLNRIIAKGEQYVTSSGQKKGTKYGLNNPGMRRAEEILNGILG